MKKFSVNRLKSSASFSLGVVVIASLAIVSTASYAQTEEDAGKYRINIAGKQRALTQRMAKAACFIELGVEKEMHLASLAKSHDEFDKVLHILREGSPELFVTPETDRRTLEGLNRVLKTWEGFGAAIQHVVDTGEVSFEAEEEILEANVIALSEMNEAVAHIQHEYANPNEMNMAAAVSINIFGRQRMLAQQASKEFCYVAAAHHVQEEKELLAKTHALFENSMLAIMHGMPAVGISPPPNQEISDQLEVVHNIWLPMDDIFTRAAAGEVPTKEEILFIATENNHLTEEMNKAVHMYQKFK